MSETELEELRRGGKNLRWFTDNYDTLQKEYPDKFVAVDRETLVEVADTFEDLLAKTEGKIDIHLALMEFVPSKERILVI